MIFPNLSQLATKEVVTLDVSHSLKEAVQLMNEHHIRDVIVTQGQTYFILTARELIDFQIRKIPLSTLLGDLHLNIVPQMLADDSVMKALMVIQNHPDNHVCLINNDKDIIGIISYSDLAKSLQPDHLVQSQPVGEIVSGQTFIQVNETDALQVVFERLHQFNETAAIVMHQKKAVGMITQTNVIALLNEDHNWQLPVKEVMSTPLITVDATASVQYALATSRERHIKHIVIKAHGQVLGILHQKDLVSLVYQSLHQRFENESQLIKQEMDLLKAGPVVSFIWENAPGWPIKYVTPNVSSMLGYPIAEFLSPGFYYRELIHPDDLAIVSQEVERSLADGVPYWEQRYRLLTKQGQWRWFYDYTQPIYDANNQVEAVFGYLLDQTHLVETEHALRHSEQQYRSLFEHYPLATALFDPETQLPVRFNQQAHQQLGYSAEVFANLRIADYEMIESEEKVRERMDKVLATGGETYETQHRHHSGKVLDIKVTVKPMPLDGQTYLLSVFEDISQLKRSQKALESAHQRAAQASAEKSRFLAYLSHEIRTPMMGILGLCELAKTYTDVSAFKKATGQIAQAGQQLMSLMNDLLDISKIEADKLTLSLQSMALKPLIDEVMVLAQGVKRSTQSVEITLNYDEKIPPVFTGDPLRLRQVLMNLLSNAIKFTEHGQVSIEITLTRFENDQAWVKFSVSDSGSGISPADLKHLFKPFHQGESNKRKLLGGTGLGLSISQQLVTLMHGTGVKVISELGKGSCFTFEVPFSIHAQEALAENEGSSLSASPVWEPLKGRVLVAEDDAINQQVIQQQLNVLGLEDIVVVSDGAQAVIQAQQQAFDLVLMDGHMPILNGFDASQQLLSENPELPIMALSATDTEQDRQLAQQIGIKQYLVKPVDLQTLYSKLSPYLETAEEKHDAKGFTQTVFQDNTTTAVSLNQKTSAPIDIHRGLQQLNGNQALYLKLLRQFLAQLQSDYAELVNALVHASTTTVSADDLSKLQAKNHSMKGVAANLALTALYEVSQQIDLQLKQRHSPNQALVEKLKRVMNEAKQAIQNQLALEPVQESEERLKAQPDSSGEHLTHDELQLALKHLLTDLRSQRYIDVQQLHSLWVSLPEKLQRETGSALIDAIENFEFEQAIQCVEVLLDGLQEQDQ